MSFITTYTGKHLDPLAPDMNMVDIRDIAHSLSLTCRGNGQVKSFFSVGQHCINCALEAEQRGCNARLVLACLIHDAAEAYLSDVPRPLKQCLPEYCLAENRLLDLIYTKYLGSPLTEAEARELKSIDNDMMYYDMKELLGETIRETPPLIHIPLYYGPTPFEQVEQTYLSLYEKWRNTLGGTYADSKTL